MERKLIFAIDFDGTLFDYPMVPNEKLIEQVKKLKKHSSVELVLWTCREGPYLVDAIKALKEIDLEFDSFNENSPSHKEAIDYAIKNNTFEFGMRKILADYYIDDRSPGSIEWFENLDIDEFVERNKK
jgi:hypothetical protein